MSDCVGVSLPVPPDRPAHALSHFLRLPGEAYSGIWSLFRVVHVSVRRWRLLRELTGPHHAIGLEITQLCIDL